MTIEVDGERQHDDRAAAGQVTAFADDERAIRSALSALLVGQRRALSLLTTTLLAGGHGLIQGVPGTGKTLLVRNLARAIGLDFGRVQFTPDLLPADILGCDRLVSEAAGDGHRETIRFEPGPIFTQFLLADEINRGTPRTQSALLESMQERTVSLGRERHELDPLFTVFATRNPYEMEGTYPLPEAQLDRFLIEIDLPTPDVDDLVAIAERTTTGAEPVVALAIDAARLGEMRACVRNVIAAPSVLRYAAELVAASQPEHPRAPTAVREGVRFGVGVRALQALVLAGKVAALRCGRFHLARTDLTEFVEPVFRHRLQLSFEAETRGIPVTEICDAITRQVPCD